MTYLTHKGYLGKIQYSEADRCYHGRIEIIRDLVTFEGDTKHEAMNAFNEAVDDYIKACK